MYVYVSAFVYVYEEFPDPQFSPEPWSPGSLRRLPCPTLSAGYAERIRGPPKVGSSGFRVFGCRVQGLRWGNPNIRALCKGSLILAAAYLHPSF